MSKHIIEIPTGNLEEEITLKTGWDIINLFNKYLNKEQYKFRKRGRGQRKKHAIAQGGSARSFDQDLPLEFSERIVIYADKKVSKAEIRLRQINYNLKLCKDRLKITEDTLNKLNEEQNNIDSKIQYLLRERASLTVTKLKEV